MENHLRRARLRVPNLVLQVALITLPCLPWVLSGCASIAPGDPRSAAECEADGHCWYQAAPPAKWVQLKPTTLELVHQNCRMIAKGCAQRNLETQVCAIWYAEQFPEILPHEYRHCAGFDHLPRILFSKR